MKFLGILRLQIPINWVKPIINLQNKILELNNPILSPACLLTLEKILYSSDNDFLLEISGVINSDEFFLSIFGSLMNILGQSKNIFAIKCFLKICLITNVENLVKITKELSMSVNNLIKMVLPDTSEEQFNFYIFEVIALLMKRFSPVNFNFDSTIFNNFFDSLKGNFEDILNNNVADLLGYVFQILTSNLEIVKADNFIHQNLFTILLTCDTNWSIAMKYMFPVYVQYIDSCLKILQNNINVETFNNLLIIISKVIFFLILFKTKIYSFFLYLISHIIS
jgi:hypothetical protein